MNGLGTIVNVLAIIVAGGIGAMLRGKLKVQFQEILLQVVGLFVLGMGIFGVWDSFFVMDGKELETTGTLLVLFALPVGALFGEAFQIDRAVDKLGHALRRISEKESEKGGTQKAGAQKSTAKGPVDRKNAIRNAKAAAAGKPITVDGDGGGAVRRRVTIFKRIAGSPTYELPNLRTGHLFVDGFSLAAVICAFSHLAFTGAIADGLQGDTKTLFTKAAVDAVLIFALAMVYGSGVTYAAVPVLVVEGIMTIIAMLWDDLLTQTLTSQLALIASIITLGVGFNLCFGKKWKVINLAPALLISPIYGLVMMLVEKIEG